MAHLLADWETAAAMVAKTISPPSSDLYVQFEFRLPAETLTDHLGGSFDLCSFWDVGGWAEGDGNGTQLVYAVTSGGVWKFGADGFSFFGSILPDTWHTLDVRQRYDAGTSYTTIRVDGIDSGQGEVSYIDNTYTVGQVLFPAAFGADPGQTSITHIDNIKIGTSGYGSTEIADIDFETGTLLTLFEETFGAVTIEGGSGGGSSVLDPFGLGRFYEAPPWRFVVTNLESEIQTWLDKLALDRSVTKTRGQATVIDTGVPADNPEVNILALDGDPFVAEGTRLVFAFRREGGTPPWRIRAAGIVLGLRDNADSDVSISTVTAYDPRQLLWRRPVTSDDAGTLPEDTLGLVYLAASADAILTEQLDRMLAWETAEGNPLPDAGLDWGQTYFYTGTIEATPAIDEITLSRGTSIGELMGKLEETGTCDLVIDPVWDPVNRPGIVGQLSIYERAGSARYAAVFGWDTFPKNLVGIDRVTDGRERVNDLQFYAGQGGAPVAPVTAAGSLAKFGRYFAQQFFPGQVSVAAVEAISDRVLALQRNGQTTFALNAAAERAPIPLSEFDIFDTVPVYASNRLREATATMLRVESIPILIGDDQLERVGQLLVSIDPESGDGT